MSEKEMRIYMIMLYGLGIKFANDMIADDWSDYDIIEKIFDTNGESATIEEIFDRLSKYNVNYIEERKKFTKTVSNIKKTNEAIELVKRRVEDLKPIE